jgi:hypothetical protein
MHNYSNSKSTCESSGFAHTERLIVAGISIPNLFRSRTLENQKSAVANLRTVTTGLA